MVRKLVSDGKRVSSKRSVALFIDAESREELESLAEIIRQETEHLPFVDVKARGADLGWPQANLLVTKTNDGYSEETNQNPSAGSVKVQTLGNFKNGRKSLVPSEISAILRKGNRPVCPTHGPQDPKYKIGDSVVWVCKDFVQHERLEIL